MAMKAVVKYLGEWAHYSIIPEASGVYHAHLDQYEGGNVLMPPTDVLLLKSANRWVGSYEETSFLQDLGKVIEDLLKGNHPYKA